MVRTRFAPSPTGYLHIGGLRTALYAYLFAKKWGGTFILRIEDTDQKRYVAGAMENLIDTINWAGLEYQEGPQKNGSSIGENGPYIQSQRTKIYLDHVNLLLKSGHAYRCFCTKERLDEMREYQVRNGKAPMYDRKCLSLPESEIIDLLNSGVEYVVRQKMPFEVIKFQDLIRGKVKFDGKNIDDQVLVKSDGFPTYHLANVVDDHHMKITHVIRGEEWLPSTPKHIALYQAFGWEVPEFAHLPLLLNPDRTKLSKRQGDVAVEDYIKKGYLKEAINNFIAFLGWNPGDGESREIFTLEELAEIFDLSRVNKSGAIFNIEKLDWYNWQWKKRNFEEDLKKIAKEIDEKVIFETDKKNRLQIIFSKPELEENFNRKKSELLATIAKNYIEKHLNEDLEKTLKALLTIEEKVIKEPENTLAHLAPYFNLENYQSNLLIKEKIAVDSVLATKCLKKCEEVFQNTDNWTMAEIRANLINAINELELKTSQVMWPLRIALSGLEFSSGAIELAWAIGKKEALSRIKIALEKL